MLLVEDHREEDAPLLAFRAEEQAIGVVDSVRLDLVDVLIQVAGRLKPIVLNDPHLRVKTDRILLAEAVDLLVDDREDAPTVGDSASIRS